ncbi:MAG: hypothetical protein R3C59_01255 [Planctomycetaceae bacterium]
MSNRRNFPADNQTVKLGWHFNQVNPRFKNREATQGEFFAADTELRAFVREAIQNSLDAARPDADGPVSVRIFLSGESHALPREQARPYFRGGWSHFYAEKSGLRDAPEKDEPVRFLVYEDSGTTGLTGDVAQYHEVTGVRNPFYYFFRAEGQSNKSDADRGRWGLGKFVFPRSSRIRTFFALTVRHDDDRRLLVGQSILRSHQVNDRNYTPDGWFGQKPGRDGIPMPVEDAELMDRFEADFCLERHGEPGLSVVIPFCDPDWTADQIAHCVTEDYFHPILNHELVVTVEGPNSQLAITADSIFDVVRTFSAHQQSLINPLLELAVWGMEQRVLGIPLLNPPDRTVAPRWSRKLLPNEVFDELRDRYSSYHKVALRVPVIVRQKNNGDQVSHFDIFMEKSEGTHLKRPLFIREGILVSEVRCKLTRELRAIVCVDDAVLARCLGDAENPAHTDWSETSSHFKGRYINGAATLRFVKNAVAEICQMLARDPAEEDPRLLLDVFSLATDDIRQGFLVDYEILKSAAQQAATRSPRELTGPSKPKPFKVRRRKGGFRIFFGDRRSQRPKSIQVKVAYDRRNGNPLRKYVGQDFDLAHDPIQIVADGADIQFQAGNEMLIHVRDDAFDVAVTGFDANRDLYLDVRLKDNEPEASSGTGTSQNNNSSRIGEPGRRIRSGRKESSSCRD